MKKGDRVSLINTENFKGWGFEDCTLLYIKGETATIQPNKGAGHKIQVNTNEIKPYGTK